MKRRAKLAMFCLVGSVFATGAQASEPLYGLSLYGAQGLKLAEDEPFPYVNPQAPKGGHLNLRGATFTKLNPFSLKGVAAPLTDLVFETPTVHSAAENEPFSEYGHLVESIELADDRMSLVYRIRPEARFSDGEPVRADDFVFSWKIQSNAEFNPLYRQYFADIANVEALDDLTVRVQFARFNQELPLIVGQMPILPKHVYGRPGTNFGSDLDEVVVGSGPYIVERYELNKYITVRRNPQWWARNLPKSQGMYNFDTITAKVYLDDIAMKEAFKGGQFDAFFVTVAKDWALDFKGPFVQKGYIVRCEIPHHRPTGMQGFAFNLRRRMFQFREVRYAMALVFDFPWTNKNLFYNQYTRTRCFFENSVDMTNVEPPSERMRRELEALRERHGADSVPSGALRNALDAPGQGQSADYNMRLAESLLETTGWTRGDDGIRTKNGVRLDCEILLLDENWERICEPYKKRLRELGVNLRITRMQPAEFKKRTRMFDFDLITTVLGQSRSIGNEQFYYFGSEAADQEGGRNVWGLKNPAVDEALARIVAADNRQELAFAGNLLDRILMAHTIVVPHWHLTYDRVLYWNRFGRPANRTSHIFFENYVRDYWWHDVGKAERLDKAMAAGEALTLDKDQR